MQYRVLRIWMVNGESETETGRQENKYISGMVAEAPTIGR